MPNNMGKTNSPRHDQGYRGSADGFHLEETPVMSTSGYVAGKSKTTSEVSDALTGDTLNIPQELPGVHRDLYDRLKDLVEMDKETHRAWRHRRSLVTHKVETIMVADYSDYKR